MNDFDMTDLIRDYIEDSLEFIDGFDDSIMKLEDGVGSPADPDLLRDILSKLHTFKGNSGLIGFPSLAKVTHTLEDLFKLLQSSKYSVREHLTETLVNTSGSIRRAISAISPESPVDPNMEKAIDRIEQAIAQVRDTQNTPRRSNSLVDWKKKNPFSRKSNVLRVDFERLDQLMDLMSELIIHRTRLGQLSTRLYERFGDTEIVLDIGNTYEKIDSVTSDLHTAIMKVRMLPLQQVFTRFPRYIRDLAKDAGKQIEVNIKGETTELDKKIIDEIGEPLLHLVRNAVDHGIEPPEERLAAGKPPMGLVEITAYQESSHVTILVRDDGRGIDEEAIRQKAQEKGLLDMSSSDQLDLRELIFMSGFSTAKTVTAISGRGVGMDAVKKSLAKMNGDIDIHSVRGQGTEFRIMLPLTLAIISSLMVQVASEQYAIPLATVLESQKLTGEQIHFVNHREVIRIRNEVLPLARLSSLFGLTQTDDGDVFVVVVQSSHGKLALAVDGLLGQHDIVIKAMDDYVGTSQGIAGSTILGDGNVVLIVDIPAIMKTHKEPDRSKQDIGAIL